MGTHAELDFVSSVAGVHTDHDHDAGQWSESAKMALVPQNFEAVERLCPV